MRLTICLTAALLLSACSKPAEAPTAENAADANAAAPAATPAAFQLNETTWTFTDGGQAIQESIDAKGNYIANSGDKHVDHGTGVMKGDKACFTSAMNKDGEECWTVKPVEIGQSIEATSDKGRKLTVTRVAYVPMTMPS